MRVCMAFIVVVVVVIVKTPYHTSCQSITTYCCQWQWRLFLSGPEVESVLHLNDAPRLSSSVQHSKLTADQYLDMAVALIGQGNPRSNLIGLEKGLERLVPLDANSCVQGLMVILKSFVLFCFLTKSDSGVFKTAGCLDVFIIYYTLSTSHS